MCETEDDENIQTEESGVLPLFPKTGHPIGSENTRKGKIINIEQHELFEAHRYILFNTGNEQVEAFIKNKVPVDLYDLEEKNCPNIEETFWREPNEDICPSERVLDVDVRWSREDLPVDIIDAPSLAQHSQDEAMETSEEEEDDFDDTDWDWMEHMQMNSVTPQTNDQPEEQAEDVSSPNKRVDHTEQSNQPVGPTDDVVIELSSLLGTLARNATICLFDILDWRNMDTKKNLWDYTKYFTSIGYVNDFKLQEKYIIPEAAYNWTMVTIRDAWRRHRSDLKMK
uniref:Uncharacterized protein n=1 Tax=Solanum lycopersicum TaxID=4081 RepID=A0A3Q7IDP9_SOLLC